MQFAVALLEFRNALVREVLDVVVLGALRLQLGQLVANLAERFEPGAQHGSAHRTRAALVFANRFFEIRRARAFGAEPSAQVVEFAQARAHVFATLLELGELLVEAAQRRVDRRAAAADVRCERLVEALDRAERRILARAAVERLGERVTDALGARTVDRDCALRDERRVEEDFERHAEVHETRNDAAPDRALSGNVVAARVVDVHAFAVAFEVALHFEFAAVGKHVL